MNTQYHLLLCTMFGGIDVVTSGYFILALRCCECCCWCCLCWRHSCSWCGWERERAAEGGKKRMEWWGQISVSIMMMTIIMTACQWWCTCIHSLSLSIFGFHSLSLTLFGLDAVFVVVTRMTEAQQVDTFWHETFVCHSVFLSFISSFLPFIALVIGLFLSCHRIIIIFPYSPPTHSPLSLSMPLFSSSFYIPIILSHTCHIWKKFAELCSKKKRWMKKRSSSQSRTQISFSLVF